MSASSLDCTIADSATSVAGPATVPVIAPPAPMPTSEPAFRFTSSAPLTVTVSEAVSVTACVAAVRSPPIFSSTRSVLVTENVSASTTTDLLAESFRCAATIFASSPAKISISPPALTATSCVDTDTVCSDMAVMLSCARIMASRPLTSSFSVTSRLAYRDDRNMPSPAATPTSPTACRLMEVPVADTVPPLKTSTADVALT